jgi:hypothetical protein
MSVKRKVTVPAGSSLSLVPIGDGLAPGVLIVASAELALSRWSDVRMAAGGVWGGSSLTGGVAPVSCGYSLSRPLSPPATTLEPCAGIRLMSTGVPALLILCLCVHIGIRARRPSVPRFTVCVLTRNSEGTTPAVVPGARSSSPPRPERSSECTLSWVAVKWSAPCHLPGDNQPDMLDQFMGSKNGRGDAPDQNRPRPGADPQLPAWSIQVSCPVEVDLRNVRGTLFVVAEEQGQLRLGSSSGLLS